jgi:hypothetical protein
LAQLAGATTLGVDDVIWAKSASGFSTARYSVIYDVTTDLIIADIDFGSNQNNVDSLFIVSFPTGIAVSTIS